MNNNKALGMPIGGVFSNRFVIPLYQRNFAWRTDEIQQFLQDIWDAFQKNKEEKTDYYIGSLVVTRRHDGSYEVVDGQQRLTVISLIAILMGRLTRPILFFDSRPEVQKFFELLCRDSGKLDTACALAEPSLFYLKEACEFIMNSKVEQVVQEEGKISYSPVAFLEDDGVADYFMKQVVLVCNEIPEDTDVAAYFEIMNNRGEQLQKHEIVKAQMIANTKKEYQDEFSKIWDACSQMDVPIQRLFSAEDRRKYFGDKYDSFCVPAKDENTQSIENNGETSYYDLDTILEGINDKNQWHMPIEKQNTTDIPETDVYAYGSIIDFPNFLMHVLRLYLSIKKKCDCNVPLNEKELLTEYNRYKSDKGFSPIEFVRRLLFCRTVFDRFVVKTVTDANDSDDGRNWALLKPTKYTDNWKLTSSFEGDTGKKIVKALSMLQVTFRTRIYKTWLYDVLLWLNERYWPNNAPGVANFSLGSDDYLKFLHKWMCSYYEEQHFEIDRIPDGELPSRMNSYSKGTNTPHFLLNYIDYLYCCENTKKYLNAFEFKYWNSVEHHLAQKKADEKAKQYVDNLGNLYLISKNANSRLSDRVVQEKVDFYADKNMGPNRRIIYDQTKGNNYKWDGEQIAEHYNNIVDLLARHRTILGLAE